MKKNLKKNLKKIVKKHNRMTLLPMVKLSSKTKSLRKNKSTMRQKKIIIIIKNQKKNDQKFLQQ